MSPKRKENNDWKELLWIVILIVAIIVATMISK